MLQVNVALPSGKRKHLAVPESSKVRDLQVLAQESFGLRFLRLVNVQGQAFKDPTKTLQTVGIEEGSDLTAVAQEERKLSATAEAFALWYRGAHRIITWGNPVFGGNSSTVQEKLRNVQQVQAAASAFAAILADGSVVTWGNPYGGGDSSAMQNQLCSVQQVQSTEYAFAAILADASVITWGNPVFGGDISAVQDELRNVQQLQATAGAFAAIWQMGLS